MISLQGLVPHEDGALPDRLAILFIASLLHIPLSPERESPWREGRSYHPGMKRARTISRRTLLGSLAGFVAYGLGLSIYPWSAITQSPLGRNHIMLATWTLSYWTVLGVLGYRYRSHLFEGAQRWVTFVMTLIGATVVTITGTLGGSLNGTPSLVTKTIGKLGWEVYMTFYLPTWMLWAFGLGAVAIVALGLLGRRAHA